MSHNIKNGKCFYCEKDIDTLFNDLINEDNQIALPYIYQVVIGTLSYDSVYIKKLVEEQHKECLSDELKIIKDII